mmetsp:Transcript_80618/g.125622  ORF Transcript_80618/g.125622 Transcript_80618/m.125622 type:complete len:210 (-) Transcript_80618:914-1543(-)
MLLGSFGFKPRTFCCRFGLEPFTFYLFDSCKTLAFRFFSGFCFKTLTFGFRSFKPLAFCFLGSLCLKPLKLCLLGLLGSMNFGHQVCNMLGQHFDGLIYVCTWPRTEYYFRGNVIVNRLFDAECHSKFCRTYVRDDCIDDLTRKFYLSADFCWLLSLIQSDLALHEFQALHTFPSPDFRLGNRRLLRARFPIQLRRRHGSTFSLTFRLT